MKENREQSVCLSHKIKAAERKKTQTEPEEEEKKDTSWLESLGNTERLY